MSTSPIPRANLKRNGSLTRIDRVRSFLGKKGKTQSLISFFDQSSSVEKTSSLHCTRRTASKNLKYSEKVVSQSSEKRKTQPQHLSKKDLAKFFSKRSMNLFASATNTSTKDSTSYRPHRLYTSPSMSFPAHIRSQSQLQMAVFDRTLPPFLTTDVSQLFHAQPWWDPNTVICPGVTVSTEYIKGTEAQNFVKRMVGKDSYFALGNIIQDDFELPSRNSSCLLPLQERLNAESEVSICSVSSYATCPTPLLDEGDYSSQGDSTPTLLIESPVMLSSSSIIKDLCQSPLINVYDFPKSIEESFGGVPESNDDWNEETEGLTLDDIDASVNRFIQSDLTGRQERLRRYSSTEQIGPTAGINSIPSTLGKCVQKQLSLTDFLHGLRQMPVEVADEAEPIGDISLLSSLIDEDEVDSAQICRAWRQRIAFANLGASHKNQSILSEGIEKVTCAADAFAPVVPVTTKCPILQKASRVSLRSIPLDTIEEVTDSTQELTLDLTALFSEEGLSEESLDLCAYLFTRAREDVYSKN